MELFQALANDGLTTLRLHHRFRSGDFRLAISREWDAELDFSGYARDFQVDQVPCPDPKVLADAPARALLGGHGAGPALARLEALMAAGRHELVVMHVHAELGMRVVNHVHSSLLGRNNGHHAIRAGGVRRHDAEEPEADVLVDGLNLARGMSFKNAVAGIPFGGCKLTVQCRPLAIEDAARLGFLAFAIDDGHLLTGPDMGFVPELADALRGRFTRHIVGGARGTMGPTGVPTARGCLLAMRETARSVWGTRELRARRVAIQGIGAVGLPLARWLIAEGAKLTISDVDAARLARARAELPGVDVVAPERLLETPCDLLAPCAIGGVLDETGIERLACRAVCGSANNQLAATSQEGELALAARIARRGIVYPPEWTHNIAGVLAGYEEYLRGGDARMENIEAHLARTCGEGVAELLEASRVTGRTPTELAYERVQRTIYPSSP